MHRAPSYNARSDWGCQHANAAGSPVNTATSSALLQMSITEEIKERLDIVDVISTYVPLKKAGRVYKALCPFHQEKTPSFVVYPDSGSWRCFGACGTGGDLFSFVMKRENLDFREALELLAPKAGVSLAPPSQETTERDHYLDRLREINRTAALYFHSQLQSGAAGRERPRLSGPPRPGWRHHRDLCGRLRARILGRASELPARQELRTGRHPGSRPDHREGIRGERQSQPLRPLPPPHHGADSRCARPFHRPGRASAEC